MGSGNLALDAGLAIDGGNVCLEATERAGARQEKFWNVTFDNNLIAM